MTKFITVHEANYKNIHETMVNVERIEYIQENDSTADNHALIGLASGESVYTTESVKEIEDLMYSIPEETLSAVVESAKRVQEYMSKLK